MGIDYQRASATTSAAAWLTLIVLLPLIMAPASKSAPLLFSISVALAVVAVLIAGRVNSLLQNLSALTSAPAALVGIAVLGFAAVSCLWAHPAAAAFTQYAMFAGMVALACVSVVASGETAPRGWALFGLAALTITAIIMYVDMNTGLWLRRGLSNDAMFYRYNRGFVTLIVLFWPIAALALLEKAKVGQMLGIIAGFIIGLSVFSSQSETAKIAVLAGFLVFIAASFIPHVIRMLGLAVMLAILALSPVFGRMMKASIGALPENFVKEAHAGDRIDILMSFEAAVSHAWVFGHGFGSSQNMNMAPVARLVPQEVARMLGASHPHNTFLQIWVELGAVGAVLAGVLIILLFSWIGRLARPLQPFALTWVAVVAVIGLVSHGAWQPWWIALIGASATVFAVAARDANT
jgi:exopolysaccharide production protein ExoQ